MHRTLKLTSQQKSQKENLRIENKKTKNKTKPKGEATKTKHISQGYDISLLKLKLKDEYHTIKKANDHKKPKTKTKDLYVHYQLLNCMLGFLIQLYSTSTNPQPRRRNQNSQITKILSIKQKYKTFIPEVIKTDENIVPRHQGIYHIIRKLPESVNSPI